MARDPRCTPEYHHGLNQGLHEAAMHMRRLGRTADAEMFDRHARLALSEARRLDGATTPMVVKQETDDAIQQ